jgi:hypothetical protein
LQMEMEVETRARAASEEAQRRKSEPESRVRDADEGYRYAKTVIRHGDKTRTLVQKRFWDKKDHSGYVMAVRPIFEAIAVAFRLWEKQVVYLIAIIILSVFLVYFGLNIYLLLQ